MSTPTDTVPSFQTGIAHRADTVVRPTGPDDVVAAVAAAARDGVPVTVHGSGHGLRRAAEGGLLLDTTGLSRIEVDPASATARIGAGARWGDVAAAAARHGLRPPNGSAPSVGVAGYLFGGGLGLTARTDGWAADHVRSVEVVTAGPGGAATRTVDARSDPARFARLRGTGPERGEVVTAVTIGLLPAGPLTGGGLVRVLGPADGPGDPAPLHAWHSWTRDLPDDVTSGVSVVPYPDLPFLPGNLRGRRVLRIAVVVCGDPGRADALLAPLRNAVAPDDDTVGPLDPAGTGRVYAEPEDPHAYLGDDLLVSGLDAGGLDAVAAYTGPMVVTGIRHLGGAAGRAPLVADTVAGRDASYLVNALAPFDDDPHGADPHGAEPQAGPARAAVDGVLDGFAAAALGSHPAFRFGPGPGRRPR